MALYKIQIWNLDLPIWDRTRLQFRPTSHSETQPRERVTFTHVTSWWHVGDVLRRYQNYVAYELILTAYNSSWVVVNTFLFINRTDFFFLFIKNWKLCAINRIDFCIIKKLRITISYLTHSPRMPSPRGIDFLSAMLWEMVKPFLKAMLISCK